MYRNCIYCSIFLLYLFSEFMFNAKYSSIILQYFLFFLIISQPLTSTHILIKKYIRRQFRLKLQLKHLTIILQLELLHTKIIKVRPPGRINPMIIHIMTSLNILAIVTNHAYKLIPHKLSFNLTIIFLFYCYSISM